MEGQGWLSQGKSSSAGARCAQGADLMRCLWRPHGGSGEHLVVSVGIVGTRDEGETEVQLRHRFSV